MLGGFLQVASAVATAVGAGLSYYQAQQQAEDEEARAAEMAENIRMEGAEQVRREEGESRSRAALARATAAASGIRTTGGSQLAFLEEGEQQDKSRIDWLKRSTASQAGYATSGGKLQAGATRSRGLSGLVSGGSRAFGQLGSWLTG